jgi:YD repeat-containing protein
MKYIFTLFILINTLFIFSQVPTIEDEDMGEFGIEKINDFKSYINNRYSIEPIKKNNFDSILVSIEYDDKKHNNTIYFNTSKKLKKINYTEILFDGTAIINYTYNNSNQLIKETRTSKNDTSYTLFTYDSIGRLQSKNSLMTGDQYSSKFKYQNNLLILESESIGDSKTIRQYFYSTDTLIKTINTNSSQSITIKTYHSKNNLITKIDELYINPVIADTTINWRTFEYNQDGLLVKDHYHRPNDLVGSHIIIYSYDRSGQLLSKVTTDSSGNLKHKTSYKYKKGLLRRKSSIIKFGANDFTTVETFKYY